MLPEPQDILEHLLEHDYQPAKIKDLSRVFDITADEYQGFRTLMRQMEDEGAVVRLQRRRFAHPARLQRVWGRLQIHSRGMAFVHRTGPEADILVAESDLAGAVDGDWVQVEMLGSHGGSIPALRGRVVMVRTLPRRQMLGTYRVRGGVGIVVLEDEGHTVISIPKDNPLEPAHGNLVLVDVDDTSGETAPRRFGAIVQDLGRADDPRHDWLVVASRHGIPFGDDEAALKETDDVLAQDLETALDNRRDLRDLTCVTIDPASAKDFDDAVSLESLASGEQRLGVHIADVSHYVTVGGAIDADARDRGTSVYLCDQVVHMLPGRLAAEACSLKPHEDRLALSIFLDIDAGGRIIATAGTLSVIRSKARLTYEEVQQALDGEQVSGATAAFEPLLQEMSGLSRRLRARRIERGALDFDVPESHVVVGEDGQPEQLGRLPRLTSHRLVEEFMLAANEAVAAQMVEEELGALFRIHDPPDPDKLETVRQAVGAFGQRLPPAPKIRSIDLQTALMHFENRKEAPLIGQLVLRAMMRARYSTEASPHFGLASDAYLHFTSPIRRYPDLHVHRLLKATLLGQGPAEVNDLDWLAQWTSHTERRAVTAERELLRLKQLRYMAPHLGEEFEGTVSGVIGSGLFVELDEVFVEGFCPLRLLDDYYEFDEHRLRLLCPQTGVTIRLGTRARVQVVRVDLAARKMDLLLLDAVSEPLKEKRQRADHGGRGKRLRPSRRRSGKRR
ncbi:MAG: ribonuclease R [Gemmatimonadetes bacterium]|jgi:ribonuclease R|nr:ribonuclease R [Gemmatimonadota bacterium]MBT7863411.1 ribonuclease R [Gemmatimonadota bacterium]